MFTGIIEELGIIKNIIKKSNVTLLEIKARQVLEETKIGDSVAVNGACLTVIEKNTDYLSFQIIEATVRSTNLGSLRISDKVNLERALRVGDRLSGHFVTGHIDCIGLVRKRTYINNNLCFEVSVARQFIKYIIPKGSVAVDGISLTIAEKKANILTVYIIPHTFNNTTLGFKHPSDKVNIEFDILSKKANAA